MEKGFETEVLTRLTKIETKLDDYKTIKEKVEQADNLSKKNEEKIKKLEDNQKWVVLLVLSTIIIAILKTVIIGG